MERDGPTPESGGSRAAPRRPWLRPVLLLAAAAAVLVAARAMGVGHRLGEARAWILSLGVWAPAVFVVVYAALVVAAVPGSLLTVAAGAMFGSVKGVVLVSVASTLGATGAFAAARWFARGAVVAWLAGSERFARLDRLTERHGAVIVAITRLVPLFPFTLLNYGFGLTRIRLRTYVFWSWLCMLPGTVLYVVGADAVARALVSGRIPWTAAGVTAGVLVLLTALSLRLRRVLAEREERGGDGPEGGPRS